MLWQGRARRTGQRGDITITLTREWVPSPNYDGRSTEFERNGPERQDHGDALNLDPPQRVTKISEVPSEGQLVRNGCVPEGVDPNARLTTNGEVNSKEGFINGDAMSSTKLNWAKLTSQRNRESAHSTEGRCNTEQRETDINAQKLMREAEAHREHS